MPRITTTLILQLASDYGALCVRPICYEEGDWGIPVPRVRDIVRWARTWLVKCGKAGYMEGEMEVGYAGGVEG